MLKGRLYINGKPWDVLITHDNLVSAGGSLLHGYAHETRHGEYLMVLNGKLSKFALASAALHEMKHAIDFSVRAGRHSKSEEKCAMATEEGLVSILLDKRNDWFFSWVKKGLRSA